MSRSRALIATNAALTLALMLTGCIGAEPTLVDGGNEPRGGETSTHPHADASEAGHARDTGTDAVTHLPDATADSTMHDATTPDATTPDAGQDASVTSMDSGHDATTAVDAGHDAMTAVDAARDVGEDSEHDAGHDVAVDSYVCHATVDAGGAPGTVDTNFENGNKDNGFPVVPTKVFTGPTGLIYVAGSRVNCVTATSGPDLAVTRFMPDGSLDTSFGPSSTAGTACVDFNGGDDQLGGAALDGHGNVVLVGLTTGRPPGDASAAALLSLSTMGIARVTVAGVLDGTFGNAGRVRPTLLTDDAGACAGGGSQCAPPEVQQPAGVAFDPTFKHFYVVGSSQQYPVGGPAFTSGWVAAFNSDGSIDGNFNSHGAAVGSKFGGVGYIVDDGLTYLNDVAVDLAGNVVVVGADRGLTTATDSGYSEVHRKFVTRRYTLAGTLDPAFNAGAVAPEVPGEIRTAAGTNDWGMAVGLNPQTGSITVGGSSSVGGAIDYAGIFSSGFAMVVRYTSAGDLDPTFGGGTGIYVSPTLLEFTGYEHSVLDVQCDGRTLLAGYVGTASGCAQGVKDCQTPAVIRLTATGTLDTTYGGANDAGAGFTTFPTTGANVLATGITLDSLQDALLLTGDHVGNPSLEHLFH